MSKYKVITFDLDGTLAESKQSVTIEMATLLSRLSSVTKVAIISGGDWPQFKKQLIPALMQQEVVLDNFILCPTCATKMYVYQNNDWEQLYSLNLSDDDHAKIKLAFDIALKITGLMPSRIYGAQVEDRGSQITFSALGQEAPLEEKMKWDPDFSKRKILKIELEKLLSGFSIRLGGSTSIDITTDGIDKAYGIRQIAKYTDSSVNEMFFIGDAIFPDGNDYPITTTGCDFVSVNSVKDTESAILGLLSNFI